MGVRCIIQQHEANEAPTEANEANDDNMRYALTLSLSAVTPGIANKPKKRMLVKVSSS
jgi:hypothetical protein